MTSSQLDCRSAERNRGFSFRSYEQMRGAAPDTCSLSILRTFKKQDRGYRQSLQRTKQQAELTRADCSVLNTGEGTRRAPEAAVALVVASSVAAAQGSPRVLTPTSNNCVLTSHR